MSASAILAGEAFVRIKADTSEMVDGLKSLSMELNAFGSEVGSVAAQMKPLSDFFVGIGKTSVTTFQGFDDVMRMVKAKTNATDTEFATLTQTAKNLGATMSFTAAEVAGGMAELATAGLSSQEINQSIEGIMNLARATGTDVPRACAIAGIAVKQFGMEFSDMGRIADVMTATSNGSAQTLDDLGEALKYCGPAAKEAHMTIEDTCKVIGLLANLGIRGSDAGNALKNMLANLSDEKKAAKLFKATGVAAVDEQGNLLGVLEILKQVGEATADWGNAQKIDLYTRIFGKRAAVPAAGLTGMEAGGLFDKIDESVGAAAKTAEEMDAGIGGAFRGAGSAIESMAIALGNTLAPKIKEVTEFVADLCRAVTEFINEHPALVEAVALVAGGFAAFTTTLGGVGLAITAISSGLSGIASVGKLGADALALVCAHPIIAGILAVVAAVAALCYWLGRSEEYSKNVAHNMQTAADRNAKKFQEAQEALIALAGMQWEGLEGAALNKQVSLAKVYIDRITAAVGDVGLRIEDGRLVGLEGVAEKLDAANISAVGEDLEKSIEESQKNIELMDKDIANMEADRHKTKTVGSFGGMGGSGAGAITYTETSEKTQKQIDLENLRAEEQDRLNKLLEQKALAQGGDYEAATTAAGRYNVPTFAAPLAAVPVVPEPAVAADNTAAQDAVDAQEETAENTKKSKDIQQETLDYLRENGLMPRFAQ